MLPFGWFGGKFEHLPFLLPLLPNDAVTFVDVFGGSGTVLLNRPPAAIEVLNDLDEDLVTFFRVLRDDPQPLLNAIALTPWSRIEHAATWGPQGDLSDLERARRFFVRCVQTVSGLAQRRSPSGWSYSIKSAGSAKTTKWGNYPDRLAVISDRLLKAQIECSPALEIIPRFDTSDTLFYCDPPYVHGTRKSTSDYSQEMTDDDHRELAEILRGIKGRAAVSGYRSDLYDDLYDGWHRTDGPPQSAGSTRGGKVERKNQMRRESLWTNYNPQPLAPTLPF